MPDFFGERYESKALKITASAIVFIFLVPYTASVYNGLSRLFGMAFNIPYKYCVIGMAVFTGIYVILGGTWLRRSMTSFRGLSCWVVSWQYPGGIKWSGRIYSGN